MSRPGSGANSICSLLITLGPGMWGGLMSVVRLLLYSGWTYRLGNSGWWWGAAKSYNIGREARKCLLNVRPEEPSTPRMPAIRTHSAMLPLSLCVTLISIHATSLLPQLSSNWKKIPAQPSGGVSRAGSFQGKQGGTQRSFLSYFTRLCGGFSQKECSIKYI